MCGMNIAIADRRAEHVHKKYFYIYEIIIVWFVMRILHCCCCRWFYILFIHFWFAVCSSSVWFWFVNMLLTSFRLRLSVVSFTRTIHFYEEQKKKRPACHNDCCVRHFVREHSANRTQNKVWKGTKKEEKKEKKHLHTDNVAWKYYYMHMCRESYIEYGRRQ